MSFTVQTLLHGVSLTSTEHHAMKADWGVEV